MKKVLLSAFLFLGIGILTNAYSQCTIDQSSVVLNIRSVATTPSGCISTVDLTFDLQGNGGNKWSHLHVWDAGAYPTISYPNGQGPNLATLTSNGSKPLLATVSMDYHTGANVVATSYPADANVPVQSSGITYTRTVLPSGATRFTINGISVPSSNCTPVNLKMDVWSAQDNNGKNVACAVQGFVAQADEPRILGLMQCSDPRSFTLSIQTKQPRTVTFTAYKDEEPYGVYDGNDVTQVYGPETINTVGDPNGTTYENFGPYQYTGGDVIGNKFDLWVVVTASDIPNKNIAFIANSCAALPVTFASFNASRKNNQSVGLTWQTSFEQNNKGFYVQRNSNGEWKNVAFVFSSADGGNSSQTLSYAYNDPNNLKTISYYRIQQVDIDGRARYSEVRAVRGEEQASKIMLFPNPGTGGKVNVLFGEETAAKDVFVYDAMGRAVQSFKSVSGNSLSINGLKPGMYSVQVKNLAAGTTSSEKFVIQN